MGEVGQRLRDRRQSVGLSISETAALAGISRTYLQRLETGNRDSGISADVLQKLARVLTTTPDWLLATRDVDEPVSMIEPSFADYIDEAKPGPVITRALMDLAMVRTREMSRDDWAFVHRALVGTVFAATTDRSRQTRKSTSARDAQSTQGPVESQDGDA